MLNCAVYCLLSTGRHRYGQVDADTYTPYVATTAQGAGGSGCGRNGAGVSSATEQAVSLDGYVGQSIRVTIISLSLFIVPKSRFEMCLRPKHLQKTRFHTPKAVTYHEQSHEQPPYCRFMIGHSLGRMESR